MGGALFVNTGTVTINNSAFTNNRANGGAGGVDTLTAGGSAGAGYGGAMYIRAGATVTADPDTTVSGNAASTSSPDISGPWLQIVQHPASQAVADGGQLTLTTAANSTPAATVQWQVSTDSGTTWSNISGATQPSLPLSITPAMNNNMYRAVWTNIAGSVTSNPATLTIVTLAPPTVPDLRFDHDRGMSNTDNITNSMRGGFDVTATASTSTVELLRDGIVVGLRSGAGFVLDSAMAVPEGQHVYQVRETLIGVTAPLSPGMTVVFDRTMPTISGTTFNFETGHAIEYQFSEQVRYALSTWLQNLNTGQWLPSTSLAYSLNGTSQTVTFPGLPGGQLNDGNYRATLASNATLEDIAGNSQRMQSSLDFFVLAGDANHDHVIDFDDYVRIDTGFNNQLTGFSNGDFNYDGVIDFDDYVIIDHAFNSQ
jgi:hypothetical protein